MENKSETINKSPQINKYEAPAIIYEGNISTRAGSTGGSDAPPPSAEETGVDLFGD